ncbi:MAG: glycerol-3-phosphate dehydrogenase/oxidase [Fibrobacteria bacterium]|nr:glycerol-3-phosphate dehydrogenase/oxidase [Fibrobacteria bacterium]
MMESFDLAVIGGGILGAACAREASLDGRSVVLLEAGDFAGATSGSSSKLVHGGLRYLEQFEWGLVRESVRERADLLRTANHLVQPLDFVLPLLPESRHGSLSTNWGLHLYDALAWPRGIRPHLPLSQSEIEALLPGIRPDGLRSGFRYTDAVMDDARLCLAVLSDARSLGCALRPRTRVEGLSMQPDGSWLLQVDRSRSASNVRARTVLLCLGPWTDAMLQRWGLQGEDPLLSPSRGDHLVYPDWGIRHAVLLPEPGSDRIFFVIPWKGQTLVGTTEDPWSPAEGTPLPRSVDRIQSWVERFFPGNPHRPFAAFSGVRPLAHAPGKSLQVASRRHRRQEIRPGLHALVGGKYTTFRAIAESCRPLWGSDSVSRSAGRLLPGAFESPEHRVETARVLETLRLPPESAARWLERYGCLAPTLEDSLREAGDCGLQGPGRIQGAEVLHAVRQEWATSLVDVVVRRTLDAWRPDRGRSFLPVIRTLAHSGSLPWNADAEESALEEWILPRSVPR